MVDFENNKLEIGDDVIFISKTCSCLMKGKIVEFKKAFGVERAYMEDFLRGVESMNISKVKK